MRSHFKLLQLLRSRACKEESKRSTCNKWRGTTREGNLQRKSSRLYVARDGHCLKWHGREFHYWMADGTHEFSNKAVLLGRFTKSDRCRKP